MGAVNVKRVFWGGIAGGVATPAFGRNLRNAEISRRSPAMKPER